MSQTLPPAYGGGEGGGGFVLGPVNNVFGADSGAGSISGVTIATSKTVAAATRDAYDTANSGWIDGYTDIDVNIILYYQDGSDNVVQYQRRIGTTWTDNGSPIIAVQGQSGNAASLVNVTTGNIPMKGSSGEFEDSSVMESTTLVEVGKRLRTQRGSVEIGQANRTSGFGALVKIESLVTGNTYVLPFQQYDLTNGSARSQELSFGAPSFVIRQSTDTTNMPNSGQFTLSGSGLPLRVIFDFVLKCPPSGTLGNLRFQMTVSGQSDPFFSYPSEMRYENDDGEDVTAGADGRHIVDVRDAPIFLDAGDDVVVDYAVDSGTILGDGTTPYYEVNVANASLIDLARMSDVTASGIDVQDEGTEIVADATDINFVGSGVTVTDVSGTPTVTIPGGSGITVQDEGTPLTTDATTLNFVGSRIAATGAGATKDITVSDVPIQDEGSQVVASPSAINFVGPIVTVTDVGGVATVTIAGMPTPPQAQHTNYIDVTTDSNASSVDINGLSSDDLNPTVTLETFTGNRYIQILQSQVHTRFTSILISGINQIGAFTINDDARTLTGGQVYRQYVTTNLITDAFSGATITMGGAS